MTLYEIVKELENFELEIDEETGEVLNIEDLDKIELQKSEKIENICLMIKNLRAESEAYKAEKDSFAKKEKTAKNKAERLSAYLENVLDGETFKSVRNTISYRKSETVEIESVQEIPVEFLRFKEPEVNKTDLKKAIKSGKEIKGCKLVEKLNMQIK